MKLGYISSRRKNNYLLQLPTSLRDSIVSYYNFAYQKIHHIGYSIKYLYELELYFSSDFYSTYMPLNSPDKSLSGDTVVTSSFRDTFLYNFHKKVFENKLNVVSSECSFSISEESFNAILSRVSNYYETINDNTKFDRFFECFKDDSTFIRLHVSENHYTMQNYFTVDSEIAKFLKQDLVVLKTPPHISWVTHISQDGLEIDQIPLDAPDLIDESFYPWLNGLPLEEYVKSYIESSESILLLYGQPGTGKSNLLKYILEHTQESALITYQDNIRDLDLMFSSFLKGPEKFLIIEDADEFLVKREQGNTAMKRLLNVTDGLTSNKNKKVIFTTNLTSTSSIDSALLREGRCFDQVYFNSYSKEEAITVAKVLGINPDELTQPNYTLAELFAIKNSRKKLRNMNSKTPSFGFSQ